MAGRFFRGLALGAAAVGAYALVVRPQVLRWGLREDETQLSLPGDELVPQPLYETTHAVTIQAAASRVWPWLVQLGVDRAGFYTYDALENAIGLDVRNADRIHPEWQGLRVGDSIRISPVTPLKVEILEPNRALVLHTVMSPFTAKPVDPADPAVSAFFDWSWAFVLEPVTPVTTRLYVRARGTYRPEALRIPALVLLEPIHSLMERGMLQGIRERAESVAVESAGAVADLQS